MGKEETTHWLQAHCNYSANDDATTVMEHRKQNNDDNQSNTK